MASLLEFFLQQLQVIVMSIGRLIQVVSQVSCCIFKGELAATKLYPILDLFKAAAGSSGGCMRNCKTLKHICFLLLLLLASLPISCLLCSFLLSFASFSCVLLFPFACKRTRNNTHAAGNCFSDALPRAVGRGRWIRCPTL